MAPGPSRLDWLGGKDNYAADREAGDEAIAAFPGIVAAVRANRAFLARAVRYLAAEAGISQFLDIGTGIPTVNNAHEVAQSITPPSRVVYVDNDPIVLAHARTLLTSTGEPSECRIPRRRRGSVSRTPAPHEATPAAARPAPPRPPPQMAADSLDQR